MSDKFSITGVLLDCTLIDVETRDEDKAFMEAVKAAIEVFTMSA